MDNAGYACIRDLAIRGHFSTVNIMDIADVAFLYKPEVYSANITYLR